MAAAVTKETELLPVLMFTTQDSVAAPNDCYFETVCKQIADHFNSPFHLLNDDEAIGALLPGFKDQGRRFYCCPMGVSRGCDTESLTGRNLVL